MELIVDLHIHSHYSRATSRDMNIVSLYKWAKLKGINIIGTGDFTHPAWYAELQEKLEPAEPGLYKLKSEYAQNVDNDLPEILRDQLVRFVLTVEISNIYTKNSKVRRLHNLVIVPSFEVALSVNKELSKIGNLVADGRPIVGMDSKQLLRITINCHHDSLFIPAHIWTPWFAMFGSKSGFDSIEETFEELAPHIVAIESGLSSDPHMNWRVSNLDGLTIVSNSDAHSPAKLGREANIIDCELNYQSIIGAVKTNDERFVGTIEFFPEEGKYHYDGHRQCNVSMHPIESKRINNMCPVCGREMTLGVDHRVESLADRPIDYKHPNPKKIEYIVPLQEIISEINQVGVNSKRVRGDYEHVLYNLGNEFSILRNVDIDDIKNEISEQLAIAIAKMRKKDIYITPGFDGVYGVVSIFNGLHNSIFQQ